MSEGFFSKEEVSTKKAARVSSHTSCGACGLHKKCNSPKMEPSGKGELGILIIGEGISKQEDARNEAMIGAPAQLLRKVLDKEGIDLERDCLKMNAISCNSGDDPTEKQVEYCRPRVWRVIKEFKPELIIVLGNAAIESILGHRWKKKLDGVTKWRGFVAPDRDTKCWVSFAFHPAYVLSERERNPAVETIFTDDIAYAVRHIDVPFPQHKDEKECIEIVTDERRLKDLLTHTYDYADIIAFDYETTGLKPHAKGHQIVTCAVAESATSCYAFNMPKEGENLHIWKQILKERAIAKVAANMKFEDAWSRFILQTVVENWIHDTMLTAHILDNRKSVTGLKFQAYVEFGIVDYDSKVSEYLVGEDEKESNGFNRILQAPRKPLLLYNGFDSLLEFRLYLIQKEILGL